MTFKVIDKKTGEEADTYKIALKEDWAKHLIYCDIEGFAITEDGVLVLMDECGNVAYCPADRFEIVFEEEEPKGDAISREDLKTVIHNSNLSGNREWLLMELDKIIDNAPIVPLPGFKEGYKQAIKDGKTNFQRLESEWICPNCDLYDQVEDDYCQYAGECTIGCRDCRYFKQKEGAEE